MQKIYFFFFFFSCLKMQAQSLRHTEILGRPTDKSVIVNAFFNDDVEACVQYGTQSGSYPNQTIWQFFKANEPVEIALSGLSPNTKYVYRLCYRNVGATAFLTRPERKFTTQRPVGQSFTFVVQADPHLDEQSDTALYRLSLQNQADDNPDFIIDLGDIIMTDKLKNSAGKITKDTIIKRSEMMRNYYGTSCHSAPLFMVLGNHEGEAGWALNPSGENIAVWSTLERKKYFPNPTPDAFYTGDATNHQFVGQRENYYAWTWGDALFIVLDPYWYTKTKPNAQTGWNWTLGKTQYDWLKTTLENSTATYKFVFSHQLVGGDPDGRGGVEFAHLYEWGGKNLDGTDGFATNRAGWYKPIKDLLKEHKVNIFFHGHDHFFGKQEKDCLVYQECPQPSHPNFQNIKYATDYGYKEGQILPNSGHIRVNVSPDGVKVDYVRVYLPKTETPTRKNKDVSATYFIPKKNCYDEQVSSSEVLWNSNYSDELIYPNPFSNEVKITFSLQKNEVISLFISDLQGKKLKQILNKNLVEAGKFQTYWNGNDDNGNALPSGTYIYTIQGENGELKSGKVVLVR